MAGIMDNKLRSEQLRKNANKFSVEEEESCIFDQKQRLKGGIDKRKVQMMEFYHQPYQVFGVSPILFDFEANFLECCSAQLIKGLVPYLELKKWTSKSKRSDSSLFESTNLKHNINQETFEGHNVQMEQRHIGILIEYMISLPEAINMLLQTIQGIIYLYQEDVRHYNFQIQWVFISHLLSLSLAKDNVHVNLADFGLWKAIYFEYSINSNMGAIVYLPIELEERKNFMNFEINKSMAPPHLSTCVICLFMRIMSDNEGQPMFLQNNCPTILVLMTIRWSSTSIDQLKNHIQSTPMACFVDHRSSHCMITER